MPIPWLSSILCAAALAATGPTPHQVHPFGPDGVALEGVVDSTSLQIAVPPPDQREGPAMVDLHWRASDMALPDRSTLTVRWNGVPLGTSSLEQLAPDGTPVPLRVRLPDAASGFGTLSVASHLTLDGPACETPPDAAWVALEPTSALRWVGSAADAPPAIGTLRDWWSADPTAPLAIALSDDARTSTLAALELDHHLRRLGRTTRPRADSTVHLRVGPLPDDAPLAASALARVRPDGNVGVWAESPDQLHAVVRAFEEGLDARCALPSCWIPRQQTTSGDVREPRNPLHVATVADAGHARGWTSHGSGQRHLRLVWQQPPGTTVAAGDGKVRLRVDHIDAARMDTARSHLTATLNGRPLSTWSLDEPGWLEASVPEDLLDDDTWVLDLDASLWPLQDERCRWLDPSSLWIVLSSDSGLHVARQEAPTGLSAFAQSHPDHIAWSAPPSPRARWALATATYTLPRPTAGWRASPPDACDVRSCLVLGHGPTLDVASDRWNDRAGTLAQPLSTAHGAALEAQGDDAWLTVGGSVAGLVPPPWHQLPGPVALQDADRWKTLGEAPARTTRTVDEPTQAEGRPGDAQVRESLMDLIFGLVFLLALFGAALWVWSGVRHGKPIEEL